MKRPSKRLSAKRLSAVTLAASVALATIGATIGATTAATAQDENPAVKARKGYFQLVFFNAGPLFGMAKGDVAYDAETVKTLAANLSKLTDLDGAAMFAPGTDNVALAGQTRSLPAIWSDNADFVEKFGAFDAAVDTLVATGGDGLDALRAGVGQLGGSCKACHDDYRAENF